MAQGDDSGAPRKTTTYNKFDTMASQNEREGTKENEFFWLENIMRVAPHKLHSVPGPRTVATYPVVVPTCPDQFPGAQDLPVACCYDVSAGFGNVSSNHAGMFAHAEANGDFWFTISEMSGFGCGQDYINPTLPNVCWYLLGPVVTGGVATCALEQRTQAPITGYSAAQIGPTQTTQGGSCGGGHSDEKIYHLAMQSVSPNIFPIANGPGFIGPPGLNNCDNVWFGENVGVNFLYASNNNTVIRSSWCKFADHIYGTRISSLVESDNRFCSWPLGNMITYEDRAVVVSSAWPGVVAGDLSFDWLQTPLAIHATNTYLYSLIFGPFDDVIGRPNGLRLYKNLRSDMSAVTHWDLTSDPNFPNCWGIWAFSDDLIFMIEGNAPSAWKVGYFKTADASTHVIGTVPNQCTAAGSTFFGDAASQNAFTYSKNYFYLSYSGRGIGFTNVLKFGPLVCPSNHSLPWEN